MQSLGIQRSLSLCKCFPFQFLTNFGVKPSDVFRLNAQFQLLIFPCYFRFGPRESKKAMMYSDIGRLNCNVSYTTFATPVRGQVIEFYRCLGLSHGFVGHYINVMIGFPLCQGSDNKEFSSTLHKALEGAIILESFPKTTVDVFALVLESGGSKFVILYSHVENFTYEDY